MAGDNVRMQAIFILSAGLISISLASVLIKLCPAPPFVISTYRLAIAALVYLGVARTRRQPVWRFFSPVQRQWALLSGLFLGLHFLSWISSLRFTSVASSVVLVQTFPVFVVLGSWLLLHEKPCRLTMAGMVLALAGSLIIGVGAGQGGKNDIIGQLLALLGALGAAGYYLIGRKLRANIDTVRYVSFVYSCAALLALAVTISTGQPLVGYDLRTWLLLIAIAMLPQVIGHTSLNWALKHYSATTVAILTLAEPIGASLLALLVLHESMGPLTLMGGVAILLGVGLTVAGESVDKSSDR